ncbi:Cilia- and flagella-associated protein 52 [Branchiostoma belcheri]|nr:Cilia- and flagella-associated protein 52 [Branchiostoma belcheri]
MSTATEDTVGKLELDCTIGFAGDVPGGLIVHPDRQHMVYPLGCTVIIQDIVSSKQYFLSGHTNDVRCLAVSKSGNYLASGQVTHMGFKADVIIWDFKSCSMYCRLTLHKVKVEALAFSPNDKYLVTLGGQDDSSVVVWNIANKEAICGSPAAVSSAGITYCVKFANNNDNLFFTGGDGTLRVWELDVANRKIRPTDVNMGQIKRIVKCIEVKDDDNYFYCGTTSGDILAINTKTKLFQHYGPEKDKFSLGVTSMALLKTGNILVGGGDGTVAVVTQAVNKKDKKATFKKLANQTAKVEGGIKSVALRGEGHQFFVGTEKSQIYRFNFAEFTSELTRSCHFAAVRDIVFPRECSELFATCSKDDIRVWHADKGKELLRISVKELCHAIDFMPDGKCIVSAWNDGKIRAFYPETGKEMFVINDAHPKGVTAIACTNGGRRIISGGGEGQVRVWDITPSYQKLVEAMKEHKASVTCIKVRKNDMECVTASSDGTCIIWDLQRFVRNQVLFANTLFRCVNYHPDEFQVITSGTDRKIGYWEVYDGNQIRELDGSKSGAINGMDISPGGGSFVTGGDDKLIKVWKYDEGEVTHVGIGHSGDISKLKISPDQRHIVSVSTDGAILRWRYPNGQ